MAALLLAGLWWQSRGPWVAVQWSEGTFLPGTYAFFFDVSDELAAGRGLVVDRERVAALKATPGALAGTAPAPPLAATPPAERWTHLDPGFAVLLLGARWLAAPFAPDGFRRLVLVQLGVDLLVLLGVTAALARRSRAAAAAFAGIWAVNPLLGYLAAQPYYYFWELPLAAAALGLLAGATSPRAARPRLLAAGLGLLLGAAGWLRATWCLHGGVLLLLLGWRGGRRLLLPALLALAPLLLGQVARSSELRGRPALTARAGWHVTLVGLGYYPNRWGLEATDEWAYGYTLRRYGPGDQETAAHDEHARREVRALVAEDPGYAVRSFLGRLFRGLTVDHTRGLWGSRPERTAFNLLLPLAALVGAAWWLLRGGQRRLLALACLALYTLHVLLLSATYVLTGEYDTLSLLTQALLATGAVELVATARARERAGRLTRWRGAARRLAARAPRPRLALLAGAALGLLLLVTGLAHLSHPRPQPPPWTSAPTPGAPGRARLAAGELAVELPAELAGRLRRALEGCRLHVADFALAGLEPAPPDGVALSLRAEAASRAAAVEERLRAAGLEPRARGPGAWTVALAP